MDPSRNNLPLQFNNAKNKPPMPIVRTNGEDEIPSSTTQTMVAGIRGDEQDQGGNNGMMGMWGNPNLMMMYGNMQQTSMMGQGQMIGQGQMMGQGMIGPMMGPPGGPNMMGAMPGMMGDPNGGGLLGMPPPIKEVITLKNCVLYPPPPGAPQRSTREKPLGCRTIFVGGIPENITEELLVEIFEKCGPINRIRISKKNFSHIRFDNMQSVEEAMYISGYRLKINDSDAKEDTGRIHIDYAEARDDQYEYECMQRAMVREMRHIQRMEEERNRPPSPEPVTRYTDHEAAILIEKMKCDAEVPRALQLLTTWLERGDCNRRTASTFYSLVQNVHSQLRRLTNDMQTVKAELEQYMMQHRQQLQGIIGQICQVERVMASAHKQRNWDHFTKAQRKSITSWQRQAQELRESNETKYVPEGNVGMNDDMDLSDDEPDQSSVQSTPAAKKRKNTTEVADHTDTIQENASLRIQVEALENEVVQVRQDAKEEEKVKDKEVTAFQNALQGMQQQLIAQRASVADLIREKEELERKLENLSAGNGSNESELAGSGNNQGETTSNKSEKLSPIEAKSGSKDEVVVTSSGLSLSDKEARMIGLISCFLHVHPNGATVDYLWSYLSQGMTVRVREVEDLLEKMPAIFEQKIVGVGATIERKWIYTALRDIAKK